MGMNQAKLQERDARIAELEAKAVIADMFLSVVGKACELPSSPGVLAEALLDWVKRAKDAEDLYALAWAECEWHRANAKITEQDNDGRWYEWESGEPIPELNDHDAARREAKETTNETSTPQHGQARHETQDDV
jgi:hypothetical protein